MRAAALVGRRVLHVRYWDVHNFADEPARWDYGDWHHAVMGVDLLTDVTIGPTYVRGVQVADANEVDVPVALRLDLHSARWMVAGIQQAPGMRKAFIPGDEIMVVFTRERMRQLGFPHSKFLTTS